MFKYNHIYCCKTLTGLNTDYFFELETCRKAIFTMWPTIADMDPIPITSDDKKECGVQAFLCVSLSVFPSDHFVHDSIK